MKSRSRHSSTKKGFKNFFYHDVTPFIKYHTPPCFPSRNTTKKLRPTHPLCVTHPPPIIEQPPFNKSEKPKNTYIEEDID